MQRVRADSRADAVSLNTRTEEAHTMHRLRKEWLQGMSFKQLASKYQMDPRTAKRYVIMNLSISELGRRNKSCLDPSRARIEKWLYEDKISIAQIHRRLNEQGVKCAYTTVNDYISKIRKSTF